jgi:hypothetical protein
MKIFFRLILLLVVVYASQFACLSSTSAELVEPTRDIEGQKPESKGRLTVLSEPPGLKVYLDGKGLGKTPAFMLEVKPGIHKLKVKDSETEFYLEPGKTMKISFFKNEFIEIPVETKAQEKKPETIQPGQPSAPPPVQPSPQEVRTQENRNRAKERWMRFVDGSSPSF